MVKLPPLIPRVIPCLLLQDDVFVKTKRFKNPTYIGDPVNTINLFNKFEVDELAILDIGCPRTQGRPHFSLIESLASECWVPLTYGGGIQSVDDVKKILNSGVEKVIIDRLLFSNPAEVKRCVATFGASSIVASVNISQTLLGKYQVRTQAGQKKIPMSLEQALSHIHTLGVGEIMIQNIHRDGTRMGYDTTLVERIARLSSAPILAAGGAGCLSDFKEAIQAGAQGVVAGSYFLFQKRDISSILIHYPERAVLEALFYD